LIVALLLDFKVMLILHIFITAMTNIRLGGWNFFSNISFDVLQERQEAVIMETIVIKFGLDLAVNVTDAH